MRFDEYGVIVMERWSDSEPGGFAGNRGDSMAETSRWLNLCRIVNGIGDGEAAPFLNKFITENGYVRHPSPDMPDDWKESDSTTDQCLPFYLAAPEDLCGQMWSRIESKGWRTGNGDLVSPIFYSIMNYSQFKIDMCLLAQIMIFKFPWRWNDERRGFERNSDSSCDWLIFFHCLPLASRWLKRLVTKEKVMWNVCDYYANEPNSDWIIDLYTKATKVVLK